MLESTDLEIRRERAARNQSLFREVNERIEELVVSSSYVSFVCECFDVNCAAPLSLTVEEYEQVRDDSNRFVVAPGHYAAEVEVVVQDTGRYVVVAKLGVGGAVADRFDPRAHSQPVEEA
jgi:hypothetical protein